MRHGLTEPELAQFRAVVLAACGDRQYPGLVPDEDFAALPDVDEIARALSAGEAVNLCQTDIVSLTAAIAELRASLGGEAEGFPSTPLARWEALAHLDYTLSLVRLWRGRWQMAVATRKRRVRSSTPSSGLRGQAA
mgnify:FL=1